MSWIHIFKITEAVHRLKHTLIGGGGQNIALIYFRSMSMSLPKCAPVGGEHLSNLSIGPWSESSCLLLPKLLQKWKFTWYILYQQNKTACKIHTDLFLVSIHNIQPWPLTQSITDDWILMFHTVNLEIFVINHWYHFLKLSNVSLFRIVTFYFEWPSSVD